MTNRYADLTLTWASSGVATDPDTDTSHPIYQPNKFVKGWIVEKEPEQWQNYLYQITDQKNYIQASEQFMEWDETISYQPKSVVRSGENFYVQSTSAAVLNKPPSTNASIWLPLLGIDAATINNAVADLLSRFNTHMAGSNPHNDNIHQIGGYESQEINAMLVSPTDPRTIVYHESQTGKVHSETPAQVGTLPAAGGKFTGDVKYSGGLTLGSDIFVGMDGGNITMKNAKGALTLQTDGTGVYLVLASGLSSAITTVGNFVAQQNAVNYLFSLPAPLFFLDIRLSLSHLGGSPQVVTTTDDPVFEAPGMTFDSFKTLSLSGANFPNIPTTCYVVGWDGTKQIGTIFTSSQSNWNELGSYMSSRLSGNTHIQYVILYPALTEAQLTTLKR